MFQKLNFIQKKSTAKFLHLSWPKSFRRSKIIKLLNKMSKKMNANQTLMIVAALKSLIF